ncbi:MAG: hypothetical protein AB7O56_00720 [Bauldia sp.]
MAILHAGVTPGALRGKAARITFPAGVCKGTWWRFARIRRNGIILY